MKKNLIKIIGIIALVAIIGLIIYFANQKQESKENILVIGLDDSFPPMGFRDDNNEIVGFDIDLAKAVAEELGMEVKFQPISWAEKEQELDSGKIDCIWNGFAYTEDRNANMTLSDVYIKSEMYFILKNGSKIKSQNDLKGKTIGVQTGSVQQEDLEKSDFGKGVGIVQYSDFLTAFMDLDMGRIDAVCCSSTIGNYLIKSQKKDYITIKSEGISTSSGSVIAFKKGNTELKDKIQDALYKLKDQGKLDVISNKWFGKNMIYLKGE
ncbi:MAG: amino acid ABC transporter substrate-binding protein [Clostridia bacterium]|nr:amino acid ABC transporter substrate-binding protein [Clostridia bacterium]